MANESGAVRVDVMTPNGQDTSMGSADRFTFEGPTITSITPNTGTQAGGTQVTIRGTGFRPTDEFMFGKVAATAYECSSTECTIEAPPAPRKGTVDVRTKVAFKTSKKTPADRYTYD